MTNPTPSDRPPLWRVMRQAYDQAPPAPPGAADDWTDRHGYAAEIRALRDWFHQHSDLSMKVTTFHQIDDLLTTEIERAERGDG